MVFGLAAALFLLPGQSPPVASLDLMAQKRDVAGLTALLEPLPKGVRNPFGVLKTGGAYEVGKFGWHALELSAADGGDQYVIVTTPLTSEDVGEIVLRRVGPRLEFLPETNPLGARITHHRFDLRYDIPKKTAILTDVASFRFDEGAPSAVLFRMSPNYRVRSIEDEGGQPVKFTQSGGVVSIVRPAARETNLKIQYDAVVNLPLYAASISDAEATLVNDYWYPMIARMPATYEITIHSPKGWIAVAQGEKQEAREEAAESVARYRMDLPVVYFSTISAPFLTVSRKLGKRQYSVWSTRMTPEQMRVQTELYQGIVDFYGSTFRDSPYPAFGAVDSKTYGGGALEAYTFATYGGGLPEEDAHEPAHTWWGGWINNTYLHSFWNESFAVYSDGLYHREVPIGDRAERRLAFISDGDAEADYAGASLVESGADVGPVGSSLGYGKGAKVLQMMAQQFGVDEVTGAMREWVQTHPKGVPGEWEDFEKIFLKRNPSPEAKGFFADWFERPGFANFDADVSYAGQEVVVRLKWKSPRYRMPLTVMLQEASGARSFQTVWLDGKTDEIRLRSSAKPALVSLDPWRQAVRPISADERPSTLGGNIEGLPKFVDPSHGDWLKDIGRDGKAPMGDLRPEGKFLVGSPETWPLLRPLCEKVGFSVKGNRLTYKGTTLDLDHGTALALVDLGEGKRCVIGLGKSRMTPDFGRTRLILTDDLGRLLRGVTDPKTQGRLTYRL